MNVVVLFAFEPYSEAIRPQRRQGEVDGNGPIWTCSAMCVVSHLRVVSENTSHILSHKPPGSVVENHLFNNPQAAGGYPVFDRKSCLLRSRN